jgi:sugar/nucleoside kinase (ribokinase family)
MRSPIPASAARSPYGDALLTAVGASLVGVNAAIGAVIPSAFGVESIRKINAAGIDISRVQVASADESRRGQLEPGVDQLTSVGRDWTVHVCGMSPGRQLAILRIVRRHVALTTVDPMRKLGSRGPNSEDLVRLGGLCDALLCRRREIEQLWPKKSPREVLGLLASYGARTVVIKLGAAGSIGIHEDQVTWMPAFRQPKRPQMPSGDVYSGAFGAMFAVECNLPRAMAWATAAASAVIESPSPLDLLNPFARRLVETRAHQLKAEAEQV